MLFFVSLLLGLAAADAKTAVQPKVMQTNSYSDSIDVFIPRQAHLAEGEGEYLCTSMLLPDKPLRLVGVDVLADPQAVDEVTVIGETCNSAARSKQRRPMFQHSQHSQDMQRLPCMAQQQVSQVHACAPTCTGRKVVLLLLLLLLCAGCELALKLPKEGDQQPIRAWDCNAQPACRAIAGSPVHTL
jgi:hypothetical protein